MNRTHIALIGLSLTLALTACGEKPAASAEISATGDFGDQVNATEYTEVLEDNGILPDDVVVEAGVVAVDPDEFDEMLDEFEELDDERPQDGDTEAVESGDNDQRETAPEPSNRESDATALQDEPAPYPEAADGNTSTPTTSTEPTATTQPTATTKPTTSTQPTATTKPTTSTQPTATTKPTTSTQPTATAKPTTSTQPTATTKPTTSTQPTATTKPTTSTQPTATTKPTTSTQPTATTKPATSPTPSASIGVTEAPATEVTYEDYQNMSGEEQQEFFESFDSVEAFFEWYNEAKAKYEAEHPSIEIGGDGKVDAGGLGN